MKFKFPEILNTTSGETKGSSRTISRHTHKIHEFHFVSYPMGRTRSGSDRRVRAYRRPLHPCRPVSIPSHCP